MKGSKEAIFWKKVRHKKEHEEDFLAEENEVTILMTTAEYNEECTCRQDC